MQWSAQQQLAVLSFTSVVFSALLMAFSGINFNESTPLNLLGYSYGQIILVSVLLVALILALNVVESKKASYLGLAFYAVSAAFFLYAGLFVLETTAFRVSPLLLGIISLVNALIFYKKARGAK